MPADAQQAPHLLWGARPHRDLHELRRQETALYRRQDLHRTIEKQEIQLPCRDLPREDDTANHGAKQSDRDRLMVLTRGL